MPNYSKYNTVHNNFKQINISTYIGGLDDDKIRDFIFDEEGNIYIVGDTESYDFPITDDSYDNSLDGNDIFILKLNLALNKLIFCTFLGGSNGEVGSKFISDNNGIIISGTTDSADFPITEDAYCKNLNMEGPIHTHRDIFISELNLDGSQLLSSTYIGGSGREHLDEIFEKNNNILLEGNTDSKDFPITNDSFQKMKKGENDLFFLEFNITEMKLIYSSYFGGDGSQSAECVEFEDNQLYIGGTTDSKEFYITENAIQKNIASIKDCFFSIFDFSLMNISYSTYIGGSSDHDYMFGIDIARNGSIIACGQTYSTDFPVTEEAYDHTFNENGDGYVVCIDPNKTQLVFGTFIGGAGFEEPRSIQIDDYGDIHVVGSIGYPEKDNFYIPLGVLDEVKEGDSEGFYIKFDSNCSEILYSTYIGGKNRDFCSHIFYDSEWNEALVMGGTNSEDFPMKSGSFDTTYNGDNDIFLIKFNLTRTPSSPENLTARSGESFVELSWDPPRSDGGSPVDVYAVFKKPRGIDPFEMIGETRSLFFNDTDVENGREYYYYVKAHNWIGYGPPSSEINVIPLSIPSPPRNLTAEMIGDETIKLKWNEPLSDGGLNLKEYNIYKFEGVESIPEKIPIVPGKNDYTDRDVINGVRYGYYLTAWNDMGESLPSNMVNATPMTTPVSVKNITAESGNNFVLLKWEYPTDDGGSPIIDYRIHRSDGENTDEFTIEAGPTEYNDTDVINGNRYWYQVSSRNEMGNSPLSRSVIGDPIGPPTSPTELIADSSSATVKLSWKAPYHDGGSDLLGYNVYRNSDGMEWIKIIDMENKMTTYTDKFLDNGKTYRYRVTAYNDIGESLPSNTVVVEPLGAPGKPLDLELIPGDKFIEITWKAPSSDGGSQILNYILFSGERENDLSILKTISSDTFVFNDTGLINGREYFYSILAVNEIGEGPLTDTLSAIPGGKPSPPANILMTPGDGSVEISWEGPEDNGGFKVSRVNLYRGTDRDHLEKIFGTDQRSGSYKDEGLENGKKFYYSLTCMNSIGESQFSDILEIIPKGKPSAPLSIFAKSISSDSIEISWSPPENDGGSPIIGYKVYRYLAEGEDPVVMEVDGNDTVFTDKGLPSGTTYIYRVSAVNSIGESDQSGPAIESTSEGGSSGVSIPVMLLVIFILVLLVGGIGFYFFISRGKNANPEEEQIQDFNEIVD